MYRKCATEISARHQKQAEEALLSLMGRRAYDSITVTDICREADISRRVFYHLFTGKTDALHALIDHRILSLEGFEPHTPETLRHFRFWKTQNDLLDVLSANGLLSLLVERMVQCVLTEDFDIRYLLRSFGDSGEDVILFTVSGLMGLTIHWHRQGFRKTPEQMAALVELLLGGSSRQ